MNAIRSNTNEKDETRQIPLYYAVRSGSIEITKFLLAHGTIHICDSKYSELLYDRHEWENLHQLDDLLRSNTKNALRIEPILRRQ